MSRSLDRIRRFFRELKRRNVYRVAVTYAVVGFVVIQVADMTFPHLGLPAWAVTLVIVLAGLGFPLALVLAWAFEKTPEGVRRTTAARNHGDASVHPASRSARESTAESGVGTGESVLEEDPGAEKSIAVLPFADISPDGDQAYFADGLAEEVLNALTQLGDLRVAARTSAFSYRDKDVNVHQIGRDLGVGTVLEGSVRKAGDRLRVTAQLVDARDGYHLWSETFDRELKDVFAIQDEITSSIVDALHVELLGEEEARLSRVGTENPRAYDLYLKGRHYWQRRYKVGLDAALEYFEEALQEDPGFALAHAGIAEVYWVLSVYSLAPPAAARDRALEAAREAVELGPDLPESYCARGVVRGDIEYEYERAVEELERALELDHSHARAEVWRSLFIGVSLDGDPKEAGTAARRAVELEPGSSYVRAVAGLAFLILGRFDESADHLDRVLQEDPESVVALYPRALVHSKQGEHQSAARLLERAAALANRASFIVALLGAVQGAAGREAAARELLTELEERSGQEDAYVSPLLLATVEAHLGRTEDALAHLEEHAEAGLPGLGPFAAIGVLDVLRGEPRFDALLEEFELR